MVFFRIPASRLGVPYSSIKYSGGDNESVAFEGRSLAGSVLSLENPMFGQHSTSTSTTVSFQKIRVSFKKICLGEKLLFRTFGCMLIEWKKNLINNDANKSLRIEFSPNSNILF